MKTNNPSSALTKSSPLPLGWTEVISGGLATNRDPLIGGIIDHAIVDEKWFVIFHHEEIAGIEGLESRDEAFRMFAEKLNESVFKPHEFNDAYRYLVPVQSKLILYLPITSFRPEAMRVSERIASNGTWFEVETFRPSMSRWVAQKSHDDVVNASNDAVGWYPDPMAS